MKHLMIYLALLSLLSGCSNWSKTKHRASEGVAGTDDVPAAKSGVVNTSLRRITKTQFINTLQAALGNEITVDSPLPDDLPKDRLIAIGTKNSVFSLRDAELYSNAAWDIAGQFVNSASLFQSKFACGCANISNSCLTNGLNQIARVLFHGQAGNINTYTKLYSEVLEGLRKEDNELTPAQASCESIRSVLAAMISSPRFLYYENVSSLAVNDGLDQKLKQKYSYAVVNQLAYFLWNSPPDDSLLNIAEAGSLINEASLRQVIQSMIGNEVKFKKGMKALFDDWLSIQEVTSLANSVNEQSEIARAAITEFDFLVQQSIESQNFIETFLTSTETRLDPILADVYGTGANANQLSPQERAGFLTRSAFLIRGGAGDTSPTKRGHFILSHLLCEEIPPPPPELDLSTGLPDTADKYEIIKARLENNSCKGCHVRLDPIALGLEGYGSSGELVAFPDLSPYQLQAMVNNQPYNGGVELSNILAEDQRVLECFVRNAIRVGRGAKESPKEYKVIKEFAESFHASRNKALDQLISEILISNFIIEPVE